MTRRRPTLYVETQVRETLRGAFQPLYPEPLTEQDLGEIADNLRRFYTILGEWDAEDRAKKGAGGKR